VAHEFKHRVTPSHASAVKQEVRVELYASDEANPTFVSERMTLVETIVLPLDMTRVAHEDAYHIDLNFRFGAAEIEVGRRRRRRVCWSSAALGQGAAGAAALRAGPARAQGPASQPRPPQRKGLAWHAAWPGLARLARLASTCLTRRLAPAVRAGHCAGHDREPRHQEAPGVRRA
jgi:hypothetical protein